MAMDDKCNVVIVGAGKVGMTAAYALLLAGFCHKITLFGRHKEKLVGEKLDLEHAMALGEYTQIAISDDYNDLTDTDIFVFCAGAAQNPGDTRLDLAEKNLAIVDSMVPGLMQAAPEAILLMVANPCDLMTYRARTLVPQARAGQIFGSGTLLDTARFRLHLSEVLPVNARSIHAYVLGEHGDHSFPVISSATIGGQKMTTFPGFSSEMAAQAYQLARDAAYAIINSKGATYYGIGASITRIVKTIWRDAKTVLPVSVTLENVGSVPAMNSSMPCVIGRAGVLQQVWPDMDAQEQQMLADGVNALNQVYTEVMAKKQ